MFDTAELAVLRRAYARQVTFLGEATSPALEDAYANVPREAFLGRGPWPVLRWPGGYLQTPDADPAWLYSDTLIGIVPERGLNNGQPSAHASGVILTEADILVGPAGALTAVEFDLSLAARAAANLAHLANARVLQGDGKVVSFAPADVIYVNAGASRPADAWLDGLKDGGRLILPLTTSSNFRQRGDFLTRPTGAVFRITRRGAAFDADYIGPVMVFPCEGLREETSERALAGAFDKGGFRDVKQLRRTDDVPDEDCWVKAPGWSLTYR